jgi:soluble lytic murein transglycosylase-like protein
MTETIVADVGTVSGCQSTPVNAKRSTNWGLLQVTGMVARERGFTGCCVELCRDPEMGLRVGMSHLTWLATRAKDRDEMVRAYNAGLAGARKGRGGAYLRKVLRMYASLG